jgi:galactose mutarotase-like enzyme
MATWDRNWGCRVEIGGTTRGWATAILQNEKIRVTVLVGKGCDVIEMLYKPLDVDLAPKTGRGLRRREDFLSAPWSEMGSFLDNYEGGWQEIFPHGGPPGMYEGASFPQHGESARIPWQVEVVTDTAESVEIVCKARLSIMPFYAEKRFHISGSSAILHMTSVIVNEGSGDLPMMSGQHIVFGEPFAGPGSRIDFPLGTSYLAHDPSGFALGRRSDGSSGEWPLRYGSSGDRIDMAVLPDAGTPSDLHYLTPSEGWYTITSANQSLRARVSWDHVSHPYVWFWQEFGSENTYPWWGMEYLVGLEPWTSIPGSGLAAAVQSGTARIIKPGGSYFSDLKIQIEEMEIST